MITIEPRTAAATRARMRKAEERRANHLRERGWICVAPGSELADRIEEALARFGNASDMEGDQYETESVVA